MSDEDQRDEEVLDEVNDEDPVDMGNLELFEGDVSMVVRSDGEVEFLIASEDQEGEEYLRGLYLVHYLKFVLENEKCKKLFEKSLSSSVN